MKKIKRVYIAGPYTSDDPWEAEQNVRRAETYGKLVADSGAYPVIPHANMRHYFTGVQTPEWWYQATMDALKTCDAIYLIPGWEDSPGSINEEELAQKLGLKMFYGPGCFPSIRVQEWAQSEQPQIDHEPEIKYVTIRDSIDENGELSHDLECRFEDGQKYPAVNVDGEFAKLAFDIAWYLNNKKQISEIMEMVAP